MQLEFSKKDHEQPLAQVSTPLNSPPLDTDTNQEDKQEVTGE